MKIATDDPAAKRLVLRAEPWGLLDVSRRVLATAIAAASLAGAIALGLIDAEQLFWSLPAGLALAFGAMVAPRVEAAEIGVDGSSRTIWVRSRGRYCWISARREIVLDEDPALVRLRGGLVAPDGLHRAELGLELWEGAFDGAPLRALAPRFAVQGIDRRDDVRQLAETMARRLGLCVLVERDDLYELRLAVSHRGQEPPPIARAGGAYRQAAVEPGLDTSRAPSFEEPATAPRALPREGSGELRENLTHADGALAVAMPARTLRWKMPSVAPWIGAAVLGSGIVGAAIGARSDAPLYGLAMGLSIIPAMAASVGLVTLIGMSIGVMIASAFLLVRGLLAGFVRTQPGGLLALRPRRWTLRAGVLEARSLLRARRYDHGRVSAVVLARAARSEGKAKHYAWRELWMRAGPRWVRLARSTEVPGRSPGPTPVLEALALEVARALDVPVRSAGD